MARTLTFLSSAFVALFVGASLLAFVPQSDSARPVIGDLPQDWRSGRTEAANARKPGPTIHWRADPRADAYDLVLVRGADRVDLRVREPSFSPGHAATRTARAYDWYVYPVSFVAGGYVSGELLANGVVDIDPVSIAATITRQRRLDRNGS